jgi:single-strand DNA-binding protein
MDINKITLVGRLTRKPELRKLASGQTLANFSVATNYIWRDYKSKEKKDKTEFHRLIAWGKLAEIAHTYLDKGSRVYVEGRLSYRDWKDAKGQPRRSSDIIIGELIMLGHNGNGKKGTSDDAIAKEEPSEKELVVEEA